MNVLLTGEIFYSWHENLIKALVDNKVIEHYIDKYQEQHRAVLFDKDLIKPKFPEYDPLSKTFVDPFEIIKGTRFPL